MLNLDLWQIFLILAMIFLLIEMFVPMMFFVNFALACFVTASLTLYTNDITFLTVVTVLLSGLFLWLLRPILMEKLHAKTGVEDKYVGKVVKVIEPINSNGGAITIYGERWNARAEEEIEAGAEVKIIGNESLIFYVKRV